MIIYETPTGALMSENDYQFLSDAQKAQCNIYTPPPITFDFNSLFNSDQEVQGSDTTKADSSTTDDIIKFATYLTGHDEQTVKQMFNDWNGGGSTDDNITISRKRLEELLKDAFWHGVNTEAGNTRQPIEERIKASIEEIIK